MITFYEKKIKKKLSISKIMNNEHRKAALRGCSYEKVFWKYAAKLRPKCDFNKVAKQFYWNHTSAWVFSYIFAAYFLNTFS